MVMAMENREKQEAYRNRMYAAGYKQIRLWVPRKSESKTIKMDRKSFILKLEELTAGWSRTKLSNTFTELLNIIKKKNKEA
jgi:hypothetical protein